MFRTCLLACNFFTSLALVRRSNVTFLGPDGLTTLLREDPQQDGHPVVQTLESDGGVAYYGHAHVGGQDQLSVFDTGSFEVVLQTACEADGSTLQQDVPRSFYEDPCADFWEKAKKTEEEKPQEANGAVKEYTCCDPQKCPYANYKPKASGVNFAQLNEPQGSITYGSGTVVTQSATDHFALKSKDGTTSISKRDMPVRLIVNSDLDLFMVHKFTAIFGIAPGPFVSKDDTESRNRRPLYGLQMKRFLYCLHSDSLKDGLIVWNDKDRSSEPGYSTLPVLGSSFWSLALTDVRLKGNLPSHATVDEVVGCSGGCGAIVDTGTTLLIVPQSLADHLTKLIESGDISDCSDLSKFPTLHFTLGGKQLSIGADSYLADGGEQQASLAYTKVGNLHLPLLPMSKADFVQRNSTSSNSLVSMCALSMQTQPCERKTQFGPELILGMPFFRKYNVQFDVSKDIEGQVHSQVSPARFLHVGEKASPECNAEGGAKAATVDRGSLDQSAISFPKIDIWRVPPPPKKFANYKR